MQESAPHSTAQPPRLQTARLCLRGFVESDFEGLYALHSDPRAMRYWSFPAWTDASQAQGYFVSALQGRDPGRMLCWAITLRGADALIGTATLASIGRGQGRAEIGYALHPDRWGQGLAQEAVHAVLGHAFDGLGLRRVEADIDPRNAASCRLAERMGFIREGLLRERWPDAAILFVSGYPKSVEGGPVAKGSFLHKPFSARELAEAIHSAIAAGS